MLRVYNYEIPDQPQYFVDAKLVSMSTLVVAIVTAVLLIKGDLLSKC
jgi:hypothetical protein